jgi:murein tripeptide amidase MpaA
MKISANFDSGNIEVINTSDPANIQLKIRKDSNAKYSQWFHFRLQGERNQPYILNIINAAEASYPAAWENYLACASYDRKEWFRVPTEYDGKTLSIKHTPDYDCVYYAYFVPYSYEKHLDLLSWAQHHHMCRMIDLGDTIDGRDINVLVIGKESQEKKKIWIFGRQHSGESMAEWFIDGLLKRLLDSHDPISKNLLNKAVFYVIPNMNPDGSIRGNLRANAAGADLNREWLNPTPERSPEVYFVRNKIAETGINLALDIHGDEALPYNFVATCEGNPGYDEKQQKLEEAFVEHFILVNPDFQNTFGYEKDKFGESNLSLASKYLGETYKCLSLTLEMPFKDNSDSMDERYGWSPPRSKRLGKSILNAIHFVVDKL